MRMTDITIDSLDGSGSFAAYRADPNGVPRGAIVVIQEVFGVNPGIRRKCDLWASNGYVAFAPDLFWRIEPEIELDPDVPEELQRGLSLFGQFDQSKAIEDIEATIREARDAAGSRKVGVVGYCLGGRLAYMTAARTDADACVGYYAVGIDGLLGEKHGIANPLMLHIAGDDGFVSKDVQAAMHAGLDDHAKVTLHDYPGEDHGFATEMGKRRSDAAAQLADGRTEAFFAEHIG
jgi:carboxymethylenebutenolidase